MRPATRQRVRLSGGTELSFITAGDASSPAVLLLHGFPNSARMFREVVPELSQTAYVIAPDLPGFGESDVLPAVTFPAFGEAILELLDRLAIGPLYIYLHDCGAPVGFHIAMQAPERVLGLIVQNANAHRTGLGPQWADTLAYWAQPNPKNEAAATAHLTFEGTRDQYISGVPADVCSGEGTMSSSSSARPSPGCGHCRGWKPTSSTPATCCSRRTRPRPYPSCSTSSSVHGGKAKERERVRSATCVRPHRQPSQRPPGGLA